MVRWYFGGLIILLIVGSLVGFGIYRYVMQHPADPDSAVGKAYEKSVKDKLLAGCAKAMKQVVRSDATNTEAQANAACKCFTNDMFEKFRNVPPGELDVLIQQNATSQSATSIFKKCAYQSGLN